GNFLQRSQPSGERREEDDLVRPHCSVSRSSTQKGSGPFWVKVMHRSCAPDWGTRAPVTAATPVVVIARASGIVAITGPSHESRRKRSSPPGVAGGSKLIFWMS